MNIDALIWMGAGLMIGTNLGLILAGLFGGNRDDEGMPDQWLYRIRRDCTMLPGLPRERAVSGQVPKDGDDVLCGSIERR